MNTELNKHVDVTTGDGDIVLRDKRTNAIISLLPHEVEKLAHVERREARTKEW